MNVPGQCHIGEHRHAREQFNVLKCPADTDANHFMRMQIGNILVIEDYPAFLRMVKAGNAIKQTGFTGSIRSNDSHQFSGMDIKINVFNGNNATKAQAQIFNCQLSLFIFFPPATHY